MAAPLDPDQLRTFLAIAETGSFTRAADVVAKTQSAVSMQMRRLEERIGKPLFERNGRMSRLSADGERLLPYARRLMKLQAEALAAFVEDTAAGAVRLGTPDDYASFLPGILGRFAATHPLADLTVICEPSYVLAEAINAGDLDVAIVTNCSLLVRQAPLVARREPLVWVASERHAVHEEVPLPLALGSVDCEWRRQAIAALSALGRAHRIAFSSWNASAIGAAVLAGLAVSVLPASAAQRGMMILGREHGFPQLPGCEIGILRSDRAETPLVEALVEHVKASLAEPFAAAA